MQYYTKLRKHEISVHKILSDNTLRRLGRSALLGDPERDGDGAAGVGVCEAAGGAAVGRGVGQQVDASLAGPRLVRRVAGHVGVVGGARDAARLVGVAQLRVASRVATQHRLRSARFSSKSQQ